MLKRLILAVLVIGLVAGTAAYWRLWLAAGPKPGAHRVTIEEGATLVRVGTAIFGKRTRPKSE